jgi:ornithine cyclodeaminase
VITTVTTSATPVFSNDDIKPGCHINGVGSYTPDKRELPTELLRRAGRILSTTVKQFFQKQEISSSR